MITVTSERHGIALVYSDTREGEALLCTYTEHGGGVYETWPLIDRGRPVMLRFDAEITASAEVIEALQALMPMAADTYQMVSVAQAMPTVTPQDIIGGHTRMERWQDE